MDIIYTKKMCKKCQEQHSMRMRGGGGHEKSKRECGNVGEEMRDDATWEGPLTGYGTTSVSHGGNRHEGTFSHAPRR
jgi:hypothetical protein